MLFSETGSLGRLVYSPNHSHEEPGSQVPTCPEPEPDPQVGAARTEQAFTSRTEAAGWGASGTQRQAGAPRDARGYVHKSEEGPTRHWPSRRGLGTFTGTNQHGALPQARGHLYPRHELSPHHTPPDKQETPMKECASAPGSQSHKWPLAWVIKTGGSPVGPSGCPVSGQCWKLGTGSRRGLETTEPA